MDVSLLQPGDLIVSHIDDEFWSDTISTVTSSPWSHIMIYIGDGLVIESSGAVNKVRYNKVTYYQSAKIQTAAFRIKDATPEQIEIIINFCKDKVGVRYGWFQAVFIAIAILFRSVKSKFFQREVDNGMICSELIARALEAASLKLFKKNPSMVIPADYPKCKGLIQIF